MTVETVTLYLALLSLLAMAITAGVIASALTGDRFGLLATVRPVAFELATAVAVTATVGSLYLSEGAGFTPCRLCWVQRAFMYPAALLLVAAVGTGRRALLGKPAWLLAVAGLPVSVFHRIEQAAGGVGAFCDQSNPCSLRWVEHFGFVTIPTMAGIGFSTIATLVALALLPSRRVATERQLQRS